MNLSNSISQALENPKGLGRLSLVDASFGYRKKSGESFEVVKKLNMSLNIGEHYAIMGETGVGKTTFLKVYIDRGGSCTV